MKEKKTKLAESYYQWLGFVFLVAGLGMWAASQPPPGHWLPTAAFLLAIAAVVFRFVILRYIARVTPPAESRDVLHPPST